MSLHQKDGKSSALQALTVGTLLLLSGLGSELLAQTCRQENNGGAPIPALQLVVRVKSYAIDTVETSPQVVTERTFLEQGSGIIVGSDASQTFIATAAHVVYDRSKPLDPEVHFYSDENCTRPVEARICTDPSQVAEGLDLAVLCVTGADNIPPTYTLRGDVSKLGGTAPLYPIGCPNGQCWGSSPPDQIFNNDEARQRVIFNTFSITSGHSGGGLFNEWWELVGMITTRSRPLSEAISIDAVIDEVCKVAEAQSACRSPYVVRRPYLPREGYPTTFALTSLMSTSGDLLPSGRLPGGRLTFRFQPRPFVEAHAGAVRLTPEDLSVTAFMAGLGLVARSGRALGRLFIEGGMGRIEGRFDDGGYWVTPPTGPDEYVPFWQQLKDDGLGFGVGASAEVTLIQHVILEVLAGHWRFSRPENAPALPDLFFGVGFRVGT